MVAALFFSGNLVPIPPPLAHAIADMSQAYPLFGGDDGAKKTAALLIVFAWKESGYRNNIRAQEASGAYSYSAYMIGLCEPYTCQELMQDEYKSTYTALRWMARSMKYCNEPDYFLAIYASGSCNNAAGRKISYERLTWMRKLVQLIK